MTLIIVWQCPIVQAE